MRNLRRWRLDGTAPYMLHLAADARLSSTSYIDDQVWELLPGSVDNPALTFQTRYGGRVGIANIVPAWRHEGRAVYLYQVYATPPLITAFAPGYAQAEALVLPNLMLKAEYWVMESQAAGARYVLTNNGRQAITLRLELVGHVSREDRDLPLSIVRLRDETTALSLGRLPGLEPVVLLEGAQPEGQTDVRSGPKIGVNVTVPAGQHVTLRWVHAGLSKLESSLERAQFWLKQDWGEALHRVDDAARAIPQVETGDANQDATIAFAYQQLMQSFLRPTDHLPHASFVSTRRSDHGYSARGDGSDHDRGWHGQSPQLTYMVALAVAPIAPELAQGLVRNYLSAQTRTGEIDAGPGLGGQRRGFMSPPLLARLTWNIYQFTNDLTFLEAVFPSLVRFFNAWSAQEMDTDLDVMPEYQDERQTGYTFWPTFGRRQPWAQNVDIRLFETPDMAAYMFSEATALADIARALGDPGVYELTNRLASVRAYLERLWDDSRGRYVYHDRDSDLTTQYREILTDVPADVAHEVGYTLNDPGRLLVRIKGGGARPPSARVYLEGLDADGAPCSESLEINNLDWGYGFGVLNSLRLYSRLDTVRAEGLSRVFKLSVHVADCTRLDINALMPLMLKGLPEERAVSLLNLLVDKAHFWCASGVTPVSADDPAFDPRGAQGGGGVWPYWMTLIGEGLIEQGRVETAARMVKRLLGAQSAVLQRNKAFSEFYHADEPVGLGETGHLGGIVPVYLLLRVMGVMIVNSRRVYTGGPSAWGKRVRITQHGVKVERSEGGIHITFPSGYSTSLSANAPWQVVEDVTTPPGEDDVLPEPIIPPAHTPRDSSRRVNIQVQVDDESPSGQ